MQNFVDGVEQSVWRIGLGQDGGAAFVVSIGSAVQDLNRIPRFHNRK
jgi:hypothetical protein